MKYELLIVRNAKMIITMECDDPDALLALKNSLVSLICNQCADISLLEVKAS